jgi:O-antigen chain-terminating methyltransferase
MPPDERRVKRSADESDAARLAEEVRAAVARAEAERGGVPAAGSSDSGVVSPDERAVRRAMDRAREHLTPSIPSGARLSRAKTAALRALRFVWREQTSFNALALEALESMRAWLAEERRSRERFEEEVRRALASAETSASRRAAIQDGRLSRLESAPAAAMVPSVGTPAATASVAGAAAPPLPPGVYSLFEERFRGDPGTIRTKQRGYVSRLAGAPGPVLDVGCGRGEFLSLLAASGVRASGVDANPIAIAECRAAGLEALEGDGIARLESLPEGSLGGVSALQVVEHWTPETIFRFLRAARRSLAPGGVLLAETINVDSLSTWKAFYLDPSHVRPVPAEALRFLAEAAGFADVEIEGKAPLPPAERLAESTENDAKLNRLLFGPQDYALFARVPA